MVTSFCILALLWTSPCSAQDSTMKLSAVAYASGAPEQMTMSSLTRVLKGQKTKWSDGERDIPILESKVF